MHRSIPQNSTMWGLLLKDAVIFYNANPVAFIDDMASCISLNLDDGIKQILQAYINQVGGAKVTSGIVHALFKAKFNAGRSTQFKSKTDRQGNIIKSGAEQMTEYMDKIYEHFLFTHKVDLSRPNTPPIEGMGVQHGRA